MPHVFREYAEYYDLLYRDKDYERECDFTEQVFRIHSSNLIRTIIDVGCGTGGHAVPLTKRGYKVTGVDASEIMIEQAKQKCKREGLEVNFFVTDIRQLNLDRKFDAAICMFAVMDYLTSNEDIGRTLQNIRNVLKEEGLFIFDFWNGLAVLRILPEIRVKIAEGDGKRVIRSVQPELDAFHHLCRNHYHLIVTQGSNIVDELEETHVIRYFFPQEIAHYLDDAGFELLRMCPFLDLEGKVDENVWNIAAIAKTK